MTVIVRPNNPADGAPRLKAAFLVSVFLVVVTGVSAARTALDNPQTPIDWASTSDKKTYETISSYRCYVVDEETDVWHSTVSWLGVGYRYRVFRTDWHLTTR